MRRAEGDMRSGQERLSHPFEPVWSESSRILILGSFPSVKSRETNFYYGHPRNRFWTVLSTVYGCDVPSDIEDKKTLILSHDLALWDVISSCDIVGSSDSSIRNARVNDIPALISKTRIERIICNGRQASGLYERYVMPLTHIEPVPMPSTSPANAAWSAERLVGEWKKALIN